MSKRVPIRVSPLGVVLALAFVGMTARLSDAAPIRYEITPGGSLTIDAELPTLNDVALFHFILDGGSYNFSAVTHSEEIGGFDPNLALYSGTNLLFTLLDDGLEYPAIADDTIGVDAMLAFILTPGDYTLALAHSQNDGGNTMGFSWDEVPDVIGELYGGNTCADSVALEAYNPSCGSTNFSLELAITPVETAPVPEPGTLSLIALGSLATACLRRRRRGIVTTPR
jgi:hypothetical protein